MKLFIGLLLCVISVVFIVILSSDDSIGVKQKSGYTMVGGGGISYFDNNMKSIDNPRDCSGRTALFLLAFVFLAIGIISSITQLKPVPDKTGQPVEKSKSESVETEKDAGGSSFGVVLLRVFLLSYLGL